MTDHPYPHGRTFQDCEAEIERLRLELTKVGNGSYNPALVIAEQQVEIERLRSECLRLSHAEAEAMAVVLSQEEQIGKWKRAADEGHPQPCTLGPQCPYCEIERLNGELRLVTAPHDSVGAVIMGLREEIARLRKAAEADDVAWAEAGHFADTQQDTIDRLRELLREGVKYPGGEPPLWRQRVREVLRQSNE